MNERETGMEKHRPVQVCSRHAHRHVDFQRKKKKFSSEISTGGYTIFLIEVEAKGHCNDLKCLAFVLILHKCFLHNC